MPEETINIKKIFGILRQRARVILSIALLFVLIAAVFSYYILTPVYQSSTEVLINHDRQDEVIRTDTQLINTFNDIIQSPTILNQVIEQLGLNLSADQLRNKITLQNNDESQVIRIYIEDENADAAISIGNGLASVFQTEIEELMKINDVSILSPAVLSNNSSPIKPNPILNMLIAAAAGTMLGIAITLMLDYFNPTLRTENDVKETLGIPVLGVISPEVSKEEAAQHEFVSLERREA